MAQHATPRPHKVQNTAQGSTHWRNLALAALLALSALPLAGLAGNSPAPATANALQKPAASFNPLLAGRSCRLKPGADVSLTSREFFYAQPGEEITLPIDLLAPGNAQQLLVEVSVEEKGLQLLNRETQLQLPLVEQTAQFQLPIKALSHGRWLVNLVVQPNNPGSEPNNKRALAIVVNVGNLESGIAGQQKPQSNAEGSPIWVMSAQETIQ